MSEGKYNSFSSIDEVRFGDPDGLVVLRWHPLYARDSLHLGVKEIKLVPQGIGRRNKPLPVDFRATTELAHRLLKHPDVEVRPGAILKGAERYWPERPENAANRKRRNTARKANYERWKKEHEAKLAAEEGATEEGGDVDETDAG